MPVPGALADDIIEDSPQVDIGGRHDAGGVVHPDEPARTVNDELGVEIDQLTVAEWHE